MDLHLRGKRALITGASRGIGAAIAEVLAEEGCDLDLVARGGAELDKLAFRLRSDHGVDVSTHVVDLRQGDDLDRFAAAVPVPDVLVNNAGDIPGGPLAAVDEQAWRHGWELKVFGYINLTRHLYARMKERGHGVIVNNIGASGEGYDANYIAGSTGNAALMTFTKALGGHSLRDGIRVVGVNPGPVATERILTLMKAQARARFGDESRHAELAAMFPLGRAAGPREVADLVAFLASDRSAYTTGAVFTIDGGVSAAGL
ncbi:SDR family oxidoreductase [Nonomuraea phyllanthi]|uniref:SDR family oxidoreductase n=1 Tax=Nonomuraea phyllanthi TaxID=2219224 RepID=A0A5C4VZX8_9ACTN|nr:SDR family oxidoreductase [Nonomuraea phyllanthi]KAB8190990.1 SDR family oxidoreductase [Nonomuraea phyllanthi]QFY11983.1 SDR family oxidoreductase [Nonomuraea phyllanthi]